MLVNENSETEFLRLYGSKRTGVFFSGGNSCVPSVASERSSNVKFPIFFSAEFLRPFSSKRP